MIKNHTKSEKDWILRWVLKGGENGRGKSKEVIRVGSAVKEGEVGKKCSGEMGRVGWPSQDHEGL